jgi:hypothetical protein
VLLQKRQLERQKQRDREQQVFDLLGIVEKFAMKWYIFFKLCKQFKIYLKNKY